jgi:hypothetical protein
MNEYRESRMTVKITSSQNINLPDVRLHVSSFMWQESELLFVPGCNLILLYRVGLVVKIGGNVSAVILQPSSAPREAAVSVPYYFKCIYYIQKSSESLLA